MKSLKQQNGFTLTLIGVFLIIFMTGGITLTSYVISNLRAVDKLNQRRIAGFLAEAGIEKAVWCLNHNIDADCGGTAGLNYPGETGVTLSTGTFSTTLVDSGNDKILNATGTSALGTQRALRVTIQQVSETTDVSFNFGAHIGTGGITMGNNSVIVGAGGTFGNVQSIGSVTCSNNAAISGTAIITGSGKKIEGCDIGYNGAGFLVNDLADAWAHTLKNCRVARNGNIPTGGTSTSCSYGNGSMGGQLNNGITLPPDAPFPVTVQMITDWEAEAVAGGGISTGNYNTSNGETLGPIKIEGDLNINNDITIGGTIWVEGDISFANSSSATLAVAYGPNSGVIIADNPSNVGGSGLIDFGNTVTINGSGDPDSYLMLLSTNTSGSAINVGNNSTNAIYVTTQGTVQLGNNAYLKAVIAYGLDVGNNMILTYESGLASTNFASGPGGVWKIKRETWQVVK